MEQIETIRRTPEYKFVEYVNKKLYVSNNMDKDKLNQDSEFMIGSVSKLFTICMVLISEQNGLLTRSDFMNKYISEPKYPSITIHELIIHKANLVKHPIAIVRKLNDKKYKSASDVVDTFRHENLRCVEPDLCLYSNVGYLLLGKILETIYEKPICKILKENIFDKIGMKNTKMTDNNIILYNRDKKVSKASQLERYWYQNSAGFYSTVGDMLLFGKSLPNLLNLSGLNYIRTFYICKKSKTPDHFVIEHGGQMIGGMAKVWYEYDNNFKLMDAYFKFSTNVSRNLP